MDAANTATWPRRSPISKNTAKRRLKNSLLATALTAAFAAPAAAFNDPDWPCIQRKAPRLGIAQMWAGEIPEDLDAWRADPDLVDLAPRLAARRTDMAEAEALVAEVEASEGADRATRLTHLFAGAFKLIDRDRFRIIEGIVGFSQKQKALSEKIDAVRLEIANLRASTAEDDYDALDRIEEMEDALRWDVRIYDERRRTLTYLCESPVILERRAFALARVIQAEIDEIEE